MRLRDRIERTIELIIPAVIATAFLYFMLRILF